MRFIGCNCLLKELELINFMSHGYTKIKFKDGINVLVGRRGSGKTAVLEAVKLVLGAYGRQRKTDRVNRLSNFVKHGASKAVIRARVKNGIKIPGRPLIRLVSALPSSSDIIIERIIFKDGKSVFKLNGKTVSRSDIVKIFSRINISPRNTLFFLPQERVNEWVSLKPSDRILLLLSALGLKELKEKMDLVKQEIDKKKQEKRIYAEKLEEWRRILKEKERNLLPTRISRDRLVRYYIYKIAYLASKRTEVENEIHQLQSRLSKIEVEIETILQLVRDYEKRKEEIEAEIEKMQKTLEELIFKEKVGLEYELNEAEKKINSYQAKLHEIRQKYEQEMQELEEIRREWGTNDISELKQLILEKKERIRSINSILESDQDIMKIRELEDQLEGLVELKHRFINELDEIRDSIRDILKKLDPRGGLETLFFKLSEMNLQDVFGPIIFEIRVKLSLPFLREYGRAIENGLGHRLLSSFVAMSKTGYRELTNLSRSIRNFVFEVITFSKENDESIVSQKSFEIAQKIVSEAKNQRNKLKNMAEKLLGEHKGLIAFWLCDVIDGSIPALAVIESRNWNVPVVVDKISAGIVMNKLRITKAITIDGDIIERRHDPLTNSIIFTTRPFPRKDNEEEDNIFLTLAGFNFQQFKDIENAYLSRIDEVNNEIKRLKHEINQLRSSLPSRIRSLDAEKREIEEQILQLKRIISRAETIRSRLESLPEDRKNVIKTIELLQKRIDELTDKISNIEVKSNEIREKIKNLEQERENLLEAYSDYLARIKSLEREKKELPARLRGLNRELESIQSETNKVRKEIKVIFEILKRLGEYPESSNINNIIKEEIIKPAERLLTSIDIDMIHEELAYLEKKVVDLKENILRSETKFIEIQNALENINKYEEKLKTIDKEIEEIKHLYEKEIEEISRLLSEKIRIINENYKKVLSKLGANGEIFLKGKTIDELELSITVDFHRKNPVDLDRGGFSSGEKTTAIMAFIMAMILSSLSPIYMFDEFDVYLDDKSLIDVIRLIRMNLKDLQGIITTTHREEILLNADNIIFLKFDDKEMTTKYMVIDPSEVKKDAVSHINHVAW